MQTFITSSSFSECARVLDDKRLNNQINEALVILRTITGWYEQHGKKGWPNHPATRMWRDYAGSLASYTLWMIIEWKMRTASFDSAAMREIRVHKALLSTDRMIYERWLGGRNQDPPWLSRIDLHVSHRRALIYKLPEHYQPIWPDLEPAVPDDKGRLPYVWPV